MVKGNGKCSSMQSLYLVPPLFLTTPRAQFKTPAKRFGNSVAAARNSDIAVLSCVKAATELRHRGFELRRRGSEVRRRSSELRRRSSELRRRSSELRHRSSELRHRSSKPRRRSSLPATSQLWSSDRRVLTSTITAFKGTPGKFPAARGSVAGPRPARDRPATLKCCPNCSATSLSPYTG